MVSSRRPIERSVDGMRRSLLGQIDAESLAVSVTGTLDASVDRASRDKRNDYPATMSTSESHEHVFTIGSGGGGAGGLLASHGGPPSAFRELGVMRIEIHGSWSVADLIKLLGRLDDGYRTAAALESLTSQSAMLNRPSQPPSISADDLLQTVTAFQLAGGLRVGSLRYGSPGFLEVIGAFNPLKTVKDGITENREINRKRDETRRLDEREREQQTMSHAREIARLQLQAEQARFGMMNDLMDRMPRDQQLVIAGQLLQKLMATTEAIANDARLDTVRMLTQPTRDEAPDIPSQKEGPEWEDEDEGPEVPGARTSKP